MIMTKELIKELMSKFDTLKMYDLKLTMKNDYVERYDGRVTTVYIEKEALIIVSAKTGNIKVKSFYEIATMEFIPVEEYECTE